MIQPKCVGCHGGSGGYTFSTYAGVMKAVVAGNAASSKLYTKVKSGHPSATTLTSQELQNIANWINAGALNN
ncbi:MAG TPA: hypothetical protein VIG33_10135 [Pseudobdellovibrionaceae bacterium]|jgi:mono/diheme cytochrome c family protein